MRLPFNRKQNYSEIFATPLGTFTVPNVGELLPGITEVILAKEKADAGMQVSNQGGWHSSSGLLNWPELEFADLKSTFQSAVGHMISATTGVKKYNCKLALEAWANVNRTGSYNSNHIHPGQHWSGVFYIKTTDFSVDPLKRAGIIELQDPRGPISIMPYPGGMGDKVGIMPLEGGIIIFPSWLYHSVNAFTLDTVRISIAFNAKIEKFEVLER